VTGARDHHELRPGDPGVKLLSHVRRSAHVLVAVQQQGRHGYAREHVAQVGVHEGQELAGDATVVVIAGADLAPGRPPLGCRVSEHRWHRFGHELFGRQVGQP
jgi:hypothetical protein